MTERSTRFESVPLSKSLTCDVLVLGSGIAGIAAALSAAELGASVILACKGPLFSGSSFYPGTWGLGLIGPEDEADEADLIRTIREVGCGMADPAMAERLVKSIHPAVRRLEQMGVRLRKAQAGAGQREYIPCFDHKHRAWNGLEFDSVRQVLGARLEQYGVRILSSREAVQLAMEQGRVCGAVIIDGHSLEYIASRSVVLATGGYGSLFRRHLCTGDVAGMGQALALDAGCRLVNMEFMQIMPGYLRPAYGTIFNEKVFRFSHLLSDEGEILPEASREPLLSLRSGHGPFTTRLASKAVDLAIAAHRDGVTVRYDDALRQNPPEFVKTYFDWLREAKGLTMEDPVQIGLFAHAANGGIQIDPNGFTGVPGLYAAGEVTGGMHGADRIGGLSTANGLVFGGIAGRSAAEAALPLPADVCSFTMTGAENCQDRFQQLQAIMTEHAMAVRCEEGLTQALASTKALLPLDALRPTADAALAAETRRLQAQLLTAEAVLRAQLLRRESRGSHNRTDYPQEAPALRRRILISKASSGIQAEWETL